MDRRATKVNSFCVLICAFNEAEHIQRVVRSALDQQPQRVLVIDDGSSDQTALLAQQAGAEEPSSINNSSKLS